MWMTAAYHVMRYDMRNSLQQQHCPSVVCIKLRDEQLCLQLSATKHKQETMDGSHMSVVQGRI